MRLIDADKVLSNIEELKKSPWCGDSVFVGYLENFDSTIRKEALDMVADVCIRSAKTVDPVKHGHWTDDNECSVCGTKGLCSVQEIREVYDYDCTEKTGYEVDIKFFKTDYCPNCGAKMDEEVSG